MNNLRTITFANSRAGNNSNRASLHSYQTNTNGRPAVDRPKGAPIPPLNRTKADLRAIFFADGRNRPRGFTSIRAYKAAEKLRLEKLAADALTKAQEALIQREGQIPAKPKRKSRAKPKAGPGETPMDGSPVTVATGTKPLKAPRVRPQKGPGRAELEKRAKDAGYAAPMKRTRKVTP